MKKFCGSLVGAMSSYLGIKKAEVLVLAVNFYVGLPFLRAAMPRHALKSRDVCSRFSGVFRVLRARCFSEIREAIVVFSFVDMINFVCRPCPSNQRPDHSVRSKQLSIDSYKDVSRIISTRHQVPNTHVGASDAPRKRSVFGAIVKKLSKTFDGWKFHDGNMVTLCPNVKEMCYGR